MVGNKPYRYRTPQQRYKLALDNKEPLFAAAQKELKNAESHRGFLVACAMFCLNRDGHSKVATGVNIYPIKDRYKSCSEMEALGSAIKHGFKQVIAITVIGRAQEDHASHVKSDTLHPCEDCRNLFVDRMNVLLNPRRDDEPETDENSQTSIQDDTLIFTRGPKANRIWVPGDEPIEETFTMHDLFRLHGHPHPCPNAYVPPSQTH